MSQTIRVTVPGANALTETDPNKFALKADESSVLIKENARGTSALGNTSSTTVTHGVGYVPMCLVWGDDENGNLIYGVEKFGFDTFNNTWRVRITSTTLVITQLVDATSRNERYFVFYDQVA